MREDGAESGELKQRNKEMFSCLALERLAPLDMMDEPQVWRDKSRTDGSETHSKHHTAAAAAAVTQAKARGTSSGFHKDGNLIKEGFQMSSLKSVKMWSLSIYVT